MRTYKCLIADDEPIARTILLKYVEQIPYLECAAVCKNGFEAIEQIHSNLEIEIVLLDINMPNLHGTAMVKMLERKVQVVFTTAYAEYAVESYELNAVDYLLKPFLFERFAKAIVKAVERIRLSDTKVVQVPIKSDGAVHLVKLTDILYCEALKNYTKVVLTTGKSLYPLVPISKFEEDLNAVQPEFLRVHRSFLVAKTYLGAIGSNFVMVQNVRIPIGLQYKSEFLQELGL
jgi:DNA-binding LytR/AlgR family response regulator